MDLLCLHFRSWKLNEYALGQIALLLYRTKIATALMHVNNRDDSCYKWTEVTGSQYSVFLTEFQPSGDLVGQKMCDFQETLMARQSGFCRSIKKSRRTTVVNIFLIDQKTRPSRLPGWPTPIPCEGVRPPKQITTEFKAQSESQLLSVFNRQEMERLLDD